MSSSKSLKDFPMLEIDLHVSVFCDWIGWYFYHAVGFKKETTSDWK
jgi:hypothetical protein